jgi:hypothetical protein
VKIAELIAWLACKISIPTYVTVKGDKCIKSLGEYIQYYYKMFSQIGTY